MNDAEKFQLKLELTLNLKSANEIQNWATTRIDQDITDSDALEICFFSKEKQVLDYFHNMQFERLNLEPMLKRKIFRDVLKRYIQLAQTIEYSEKLIHSLFNKLLELSTIADDEVLYNFIMHYDDEFYLSVDGFSNLVHEQVWSIFINQLEKWFSSNSNSI
ncbi:hypothetical protein [Acinetobacter sp. ANC 3832]|uniref:hypothetical protein n=1 Tax=Acinetobacter sp. ANC 3832 TaxID=1977874 RepID=UPI000A34BE1A|nr:hypothetical protein [Acinetobacter sp. ANC 3832]OTG86899.1 hypothetical protein B9T35_17955 [Acinetobacter sp. ANC 3832]